jgi:multicomponent Na+:H+ antiporter subunit A
LFLFMGAMLGLVLADNLITLFVFWELTSVSSFGLIGLESDKPSARAAATQALFVTGAGGLAMLAGFVLLGMEAGSLSLTEVLAQGSIIDKARYEPILALVLLGAFTKSAQVPFHFWLPNAMEAPTPVSAYLHSATMVKAGIYLLARLSPVLAGSDLWFYAVSAAGGATMVTGAVLALLQTDLKRILAYSTLSILGSLVFLLGIGTDEAVYAALVLLGAHAAYKAILFLCAGIIDHETGMRDIRELGGLWRAMPVTAACVLVAGLSMAGIAPLLGFVAKESIYEALLHAGRHALLATAVGVAANVIMVAIALLLLVRPFLGPPRDYGRHVHEAGWLLLAGPVVLCVFSFATGIVPSTIESSLVGNPASQVLGRASDVHLELWHGFNTALGLSAITLALGVLAYLAHERIVAVLGRGKWSALSPGYTYDRLMAGLVWVAEAQTRLLQHGYLRGYFAVILGSMVLLAFGTTVVKADLDLPGFSPLPRIEEAGVLVIVLVGALLAVGSGSRIVAIIALGVVGYGVALIYALGGAPDLAITQILVETLIVLLMVFAFYRLPRFATYSQAGTRLRDGILATAAGATVTMLVLTTLTIEQDNSLSRRLSELSKTEAHGANVVNVILVDFRALDTLGEITVLAVAVVGIISLLRATARWRSDE